MKTLVIPDIHTQIKIADGIIAKEPHDQLVLLGDVFDDWDDTIEVTTKVALWYREKLHETNTTVLLGNHDIAYAAPSRYTQCSGFSQSKLMAIDKVLVPSRACWSRTKFFTWVDDILLSHAGLTQMHIPEELIDWADIAQADIAHVRSWLNETHEKARDAMFRGWGHWLFQCGRERGGSALWGGLTWLDFNAEFECPGFKQIVGHTYHDEPKHNGLAVDIDCNLRYYAVITDGSIEIKKNYTDV